MFFSYLILSDLSVTCSKSVIFSRYSTNKTDSYDIAETLLKVALNTVALTLTLISPLPVKPKATIVLGSVRPSH